MAKKKDVVPVFVDNVEALEAKIQAMREAQKIFACRIRQSSRAQSPQPPCRRSGSPRREHLSESPLRAHPALPEVHQPGAGAELPLFALLQPVRHRGHPHPRLRQRAAADGVAHRPVQSAGPLGLRPRTGKGPLEKSGPASLGLGSVFHQTQKISGKPLR